MNRRSFGFTLIELLAVVAIASIALLVAVPSGARILKNNRIVTQTNDFISALALARSEAATRSQSVVICVSADLTTCQGSGDFDEGWLMFEDTDGDTVLDAGETIIRVGQALPGTLTLEANSGDDTITFTALGRAVATDSFALCWDADEEGRDISLSRTGRAESSYRNSSASTGGC